MLAGFVGAPAHLLGKLAAAADADAGRGEARRGMGGACGMRAELCGQCTVTSTPTGEVDNCLLEGGDRFARRHTTWVVRNHCRAASPTTPLARPQTSLCLAAPHCRTAHRMVMPLAAVTCTQRERPAMVPWGIANASAPLLIYTRPVCDVHTPRNPLDGNLKSWCNQKAQARHTP